MELTHLTDSQIQDFLDGNRQANESQLRLHLESCQLCQGTVEQYKLLYEELARPVEVALRPGFVARMADRFESEYVAARESSLVDRLLWSSIGVAAALAIYFFVNWSTLLTDLANNTAWQTLFSREQLSSLSTLMAEHQIDPAFPAIAALALLVFGNLDTIIRHFRHRSYMCC